MRVFLITLLLLPAVSAICISLAPYHAAAAALAEGLGDIVSQSVCRYGNDTRLDAECPIPCKALISATWGDCYCKQPDYKPGVSNPLVKSLTVKEMFELMATKEYVSASNCRSFLNTTDSMHKWKCE